METEIANPASAPSVTSDAFFRKLIIVRASLLVAVSNSLFAQTKQRCCLKTTPLHPSVSHCSIALSI